jgi:hypothetical protein
MSEIRMFTISVEYDEDDTHDVAAVNRLAADFEDCIAKAGLALDNLEEEDI